MIVCNYLNGYTEKQKAVLDMSRTALDSLQLFNEQRETHNMHRVQLFSTRTRSS